MRDSNAVNRFSKEHSQGWRSRTSAHKERIAALLIERAEQGMGVQAADLYDHPELYGHSPRNRISELGKDDGWDIGRKSGERNCFFYWLRRDGQGRTYPTQRFDEPPNAPRPQLVKQPDSLWDDRPRVTGLPLFDAAVRP